MPQSGRGSQVQEFVRTAWLRQGAFEVWSEWSGASMGATT